MERSPQAFSPVEQVGSRPARPSPGEIGAVLADQARRLVELLQLEVYRARAVVADTLPEPIRLSPPHKRKRPGNGRGACCVRW